MFNQVALPEADQGALRFLWRQSPESPIEVYQYVRHIFGAKCAPTCSNYALLKSAEDIEMKFPIASLAVKPNFYMNDFFKSVKSTGEAMEIQRQLAQMPNLGGFHLTKWISNEKEVIEQISESERAPSVKVVDENIVMPVESALGFSWDTNSDCFVYGAVKRNIADTCRKMLSLIASLFDPIGFLAPFLVRAKILLQRMWQCGIGWDDVLPSELLEEWSQWQEELDGISQFRVFRFYRHVPDSPSAIELHVFGDASEQAFCSVAYLRFCYASGAVKCAFVMAKTRVAPKKPLSIPKLELQAALLSARLSLVASRNMIISLTLPISGQTAVLCFSGFVGCVSDTLPLQLTELGIVRAGGRIDRADIPFYNGHPILLSPDHEFTRLIIMDCHERLKHEGVDYIRNELRQQYLILRCRVTVRKILHQCSYCRRRKAKPVPPMMASLPSDRVQVAPAFSKVGVDFLGPLRVKHLRKQEKRCGCLFTCLVTIAVHLEVAFSLSTDSFIMCLRRFIARRGKPSVIYSDNGTNFVGANHELRKSIDDWNQDII
ncbi:uncharacterized protein [Acropora muricata]|uniref:uncharacterized protein n=1 Tax=Acropora muricata TaxID=159855 RepID=UPI0034E60757